MPVEDTVQDTEEAKAEDTTQEVADQAEVGKDGKPFDAARAQALIEKLQGENRALKPKAKLADELTAAEKKRADAGKSDLEKAQSERDAALKALETTNKKLVAVKYSLPEEFASRIVGSTLEEMDADAAALAKALPAKKATEDKVVTNPTNMASGPVKATDAQWREYLYNNGPMPGV